MKKIISTIAPLAMILASCSPVVYTGQNNPQPVVYQDPPQQQTAYDQPITDQVFYDELSPYGQWIDYPDYGYVWQPNVDADFRPYDTNGNWVYSEDGWTWVSNYSWGWAPFHYGRWFFDGSYGWMWMPGNEWAPAWVTWGQSGNYYGWAPVPPHVGYNSGWRPQDNDWNFVDARHIDQTNVNYYIVRNNVTVINNTTIINNTVTYNNAGGNHRGFTYNRGPRVNEVEGRTHTVIQPVRINTTARPGRQSVTNGQLTLYRPVINTNQARDGKRPAPQHVVNFDQAASTNPQGQTQRPGRGQGGNQNNGSQPVREVNYGQGGNQPGNTQQQNSRPNRGQTGGYQQGQQLPVPQTNSGQGSGQNGNQPQQNPIPGRGQGGYPNNSGQPARQGNAGQNGNQQQVQPTPRPNRGQTSGQPNGNQPGQQQPVSQGSNGELNNPNNAGQPQQSPRPNNSQRNNQGYPGQQQQNPATGNGQGGNPAMNQQPAQQTPRPASRPIPNLKIINVPETIRPANAPAPQPRPVQIVRPQPVRTPAPAPQPPRQAPKPKPQVQDQQ